MLAILSSLATLALNAAAGPVHEAELPDLNLKFTFPELEDYREHKRGNEEGSWSGKLGEHDLSIGLIVFEDTDFWLEPGYVTEHVVEFLRRETEFDVIDASFLQGAYGHATYASLVEGTLPEEGSSKEGIQYLLGGLLEGEGYLLYVECRPIPDDATRATLETFLKEGIAYDGPVRDPNWTDEEVLERWKRDAPDDLHEDFEKGMKKKSTKKKIVIRTDHYLIMTNASSGKMPKKLEEYYDEIREVYPFPEIEGRRLMPIFLFRSPEGYYDYYVKIAKTSRASAEKSKGHAWRDYYATWYEAPGDPVHIHEMTHQVFSNRLHLGGGGSWFQEGVAEYIETSDNDRNDAARRVKKGEHVKLMDFVQLRSLLGSSEEDVRGQGGAGDAYKQAALLIEFLRESKFGKGKFEAFLHTMGKVSRGNVEKIDAAFQSVYGFGIIELEEEWVKYCAKR
jgi:hypothetical protein